MPSQQQKQLEQQREQSEMERGSKRSNPRDISPHSRQVSSSEQSPTPKGQVEWKFHLPMTNLELLENLSKFLHPYEKTEILNYKDIYFFNILDRKMPEGMTPPSGAVNNGYDNQQGEYLFQLRDHI